MDKRFLIIATVLVLGFGGYLVLGRGNNNSQDSNTSVTTEASSYTSGKGNKNVTIVEYADFECPACGGFYPLIKEIKRKYGDDITFQFRNFPIDTIHQNARAAHRAAIAAGNQGKFFEMHDLLFENQRSWSRVSNARSIFDSFAQQLNLDMAKFSSDFASEATNSIINADKDAGTKLGVTGTPTFYINGKQLENTEIDTLESFSSKIDAEIAASSSAQNNQSPSSEQLAAPTNN